ncbi:hypothetical protein PHJA_001104300 [Phtheirospermum japonicum]|uniref:DOG1 domain-containing protein n=1 Tax=Phtheirospermum japonicum TaxID=374723 RepID=A0A830BRX7_9LAMI|nr:hypothetical protein PHJA_001104300 [Phtheirospermum japonicum]
MKTQIQIKFSKFYEKWISQLENLLSIILIVLRESREDSKACESEYHKLLAHHKEYYTSKWATATENALIFFCPVWLSPLEISHMWFTGWRPSMAFQIVRSLNEEQLKKIEGLQAKIKEEEVRVGREMERHSRQMTSWKTLLLVRLDSEPQVTDTAVLKQVHEMVESVKTGMASGMEKVAKMADCIRRKTLRGLLDVLTPIQRLEFLAAMSMFQIQLMKRGKSELERELELD